MQKLRRVFNMASPRETPASFASRPDDFGRRRGLTFPPYGQDDPRSETIRAAVLQHRVALALRERTKAKSDDRVSLGMVARHLGWAPSRLSRILKGHVWLTLTDAFRLSMISGTPLSCLAQGVEGHSLSEVEELEVLARYAKEEAARLAEKLETAQKLQESVSRLGTRAPGRASPR